MNSKRGWDVPDSLFNSFLDHLESDSIDVVRDSLSKIWITFQTG